MRLAVVSSHPIQYYSPLFRELARHVDLGVFFAHKATPEQQAAAGFGRAFDWDIDLLSGFEHRFLRNVAAKPSAGHFSGCDTPDVGDALREGRYDAVLVTGWHLKTYWQTVWAAKRLGIPVLVRGDSQLGTARSRLKLVAKALLYPRLLRLFDAILYTGQKNKTYLERYRYPVDRQCFSPHCVDTSWFRDRATQAARCDLRKRLGVADETQLILFAGKLIPFKRPLDVVDIAGRVASRGKPVEVLVAGSGELASPMAEHAAASGVAIHFLGFCNQSEMPAVYAAADVLVLPSEARETWGLVANEALASGTPVVLSDAVGSSRDLEAFPAVVAQYPCANIERAADVSLALLDEPRRCSDFNQFNSAYGLAAAAAGILEAATVALVMKHGVARRFGPTSGGLAG